MAKLLATFFLSCGLAGICAGAVAVYVLGDFDPKFRDSISSAFEIELIGVAVATVIGTVLAALALAFVHARIKTEGRAIAIAFAWGVAYPLFARFAISPLVGMFDPESVSAGAIAWVFIIGFPLLIFAPLTALAGVRNSSGQASAL